MSNNNEFYDYFNENFNNCEILPNGGYHVENGENNFYFSSECNDNGVNLVSYYPGIGGAQADAKSWMNSLEENGIPSNSVIIIASNHRDNGNTLETFDHIAQDLAIKVSNVQGVCFSGSGDTGFKRINDYILHHDELKDSSSLVVIDGYNINANYVSCEQLKENQTPIYMVTPSEQIYSNRVKLLDTALNDKGLNTYLVELDSNNPNDPLDHPGTNEVVLLDGFSPYIAGVDNKLGNRATYNFYKYQNGNYETINMANVHNFYSNNNKVSYLSNLRDIPNEIQSSNYNTSDFDSLNISDTTILNNYLNNILSSIRTGTYNNGLHNSSFSSTTNVPTQFSNLMESYFSVKIDLMDKLANNVYKFSQIGKSKEQLDKYLANTVSGFETESVVNSTNNLKTNSFKTETTVNSTNNLKTNSFKTKTTVKNTNNLKKHGLISPNIKE